MVGLTTPRCRRRFDRPGEVELDAKTASLGFAPQAVAKGLLWRQCERPNVGPGCGDQPGGKRIRGKVLLIRRARPGRVASILGHTILAPILVPVIVLQPKACGRPRDPPQIRERSKPEPGIFMPAFRAPAQLGCRGGRVQGVAADAVERGLAPLQFEPPVIAPIIPQPQAEEDQAHECAIDDRSRGKIKHGRTPVRSSLRLGLGVAAGPGLRRLRRRWGSGGSLSRGILRGGFGRGRFFGGGGLLRPLFRLR